MADAHRQLALDMVAALNRCSALLEQYGPAIEKLAGSRRDQALTAAAGLGTAAVAAAAPFLERWLGGNEDQELDEDQDPDDGDEDEFEDFDEEEDERPAPGRKGRPGRRR